MQPERLTAVTNLLNTTYAMNVTEQDVAIYLSKFDNRHDRYHQRWCNLVSVETIAQTLANSRWGKDMTRVMIRLIE